MSAASWRALPNTPTLMPKPQAETAQMTTISVVCQPLVSGNVRKKFHQKNIQRLSFASMVTTWTMKASRYSIAACTLAAAYAPIKRSVCPHVFSTAIALPSIETHAADRHLIHYKQNNAPYAQS